ncbi:Heat shock transcription factor [Handroanthus impetiginosus]|uniref:Heat shock transcription factor n=1 Tax=Handroanthus impetiginosus TaxID=429701 RepID=A0A2G9HVA4_9LAMI|nr:Heat shock transcription factor [Handroanthus impetiginosus]
MEKNSLTENEGCGDGGQEWKSSPPPFLKKIYEMVDDIGTNSIISWNSSGTGFIIWDHNKFSAEVLPRHFRSSNFSSFVYQLNNYGFRKMSWERYEYANPWFQAGKKHWLNNIKRRNQQFHPTKKRSSFTAVHDSINATMETKLFAIMTEQNDMKWTIQKLKQSLDNMENQLAILEINTKLQEFKEEKMNIAVFLKKFFQFLRKKKDEATDDTPKRPKSDEVFKQKISSSAHNDDSESSILDRKLKNTTEHAENCRFWKNMLEDGQGDLSAHHSKAIMELDEMMALNIAIEREILIEKPCDPNVEDDGHLELWT